MNRLLSWGRWIAAAVGAALVAFLAGRVSGRRNANEAAREADERRADQIREVQVDREKIRSIDDIALDGLLRRYRDKQH